MSDFIDIGFRSISVYVFMLIGLRVFGKNQLSQLNAGDVILLLLISNAVQNAMVGQNTSLGGGLFAALILFLANFLLKKIMVHNKKIKNLIESEPIILIRDGLLLKTEIEKAEVTLDEIEESIREHGVEKTEDVQLLTLEVDGNISVISKDKNNQTQYSKYRRKKMRDDN
jgi:uncharacterized membrane protein YcaP (DUF421 family)